MLTNCNYNSIYAISVDIASDQSLKVEIGKRKNSDEKWKSCSYFVFLQVINDHAIGQTQLHTAPVLLSN
jgi:hypothetical protein